MAERQEGWWWVKYVGGTWAMAEVEADHSKEPDTQRLVHPWLEVLSIGDPRITWGPYMGTCPLHLGHLMNKRELEDRTLILDALEEEGLLTDPDQARSLVLDTLNYKPSDTTSKRTLTSPGHTEN